MQEKYKEIERIKIRNEKTLEGALYAIITTSHDNKIIFFNQAAEELLFYQKQEIIDKNISILFSEKAIDEDEFITKYISPGDEKIIGERKAVKIKTKHGDEIPILIFLSKAVVDKENTFTAFIETV
jgi:PAS domain S-box-containing protein